MNSQDQRDGRHPATHRNQISLYQQWIANDRQLRTLIGQMRKVAANVIGLIVKEAVGE